MRRIKNVYSPAGMGFDTEHVRHATDMDCPKCRYGTIFRKDESFYECIDCGEKFRVSALEAVHKLKRKNKQ